jgi:hypothetical protein
MPTSKYQVESSCPMVGPLLPDTGPKSVRLHHQGLAIAVAAKSVTVPRGSEIRVVHIASGEVVFRTTASAGGSQ